MKSYAFILIGMCGILTGCSTVVSTCYYTQGTGRLTQGDYEGAIKKLEKAVKFDPTTPKNLHNLAVAYIAAGNVEQAWYYSRKAVLCGNTEQMFIQMFEDLANLLIRKQGLNTEGTALEEVLSKLGDPDYLKQEGNLAKLSYGLIQMTFSEGKLVNCVHR